MKALNCSSYDRKPAIAGAITAALAAVVLILFTASGSAGTAGKGGGVQAPVPKAAATTTTSKVARDVQAQPNKAYDDKTCQQPRRPRSCYWQHQH
jgi:hypothetical protein